MGLFDLIRKIWYDPVLSKVIACGIIAVIGGCFTILRKFNLFKLNNTAKAKFILFNKNKPNIKWLNEYFNNGNEFDKGFLMWFPLNGVMKSPPHCLSLEDDRKISSSRRIKPLIDKGIISYSYLSGVEINEKVYDFLSNYLDESYSKSSEKDRDALICMKDIDFYKLLLFCATHTDYDEKMRKEIKLLEIMRSSLTENK